MNRELLQAEMNKRNISIAELASLSEVDRTTIFRILKKNRNCSVTIAAKIVHALRLKPKQAMEIFFDD